MDDLQDKQGFELIPIPQDALGEQAQQATHEVRRIWDKEKQLW